jgi:hypothetical protein
MASERAKRVADEIMRLGIIEPVTYPTGQHGDVPPIEHGLAVDFLAERLELFSSQEIHVGHDLEVAIGRDGIAYSVDVVPPGRIIHASNPLLMRGRAGAGTPDHLRLVFWVEEKKP